MWVDFLKALFGKDWPVAHMGFCFDTEYVPHYISWLEDPAVRSTLNNTFVVPPKFHFRKHLAETVLACKANLVHFFCPLLTRVLKSNLKKWGGVSDEANGEDEDQETRVAPGAIFEGLDGGTADEVAALFTAVTVDTPEEAIADELGIDEDLEEDDDEGEEEGGEEEELADNATGAAVGAVVTVAAAAAGVAAAGAAAAPRDAEAILPELKFATDVRTLTEKSAKGNRKLRPIGEVRLVARHLGIVVGVPGKFVDRKVVCDKIIKVLKLGKEKKTRPAEAKVKMNLHRLNQLLWYCHFRWDGARWRGGNLRSKVVELCRVKYNEDGQRKLSDNQLLGFACDDSSMFCGLFKLLDMEIRLAVEPFILWEEGDFRPFLRALPSMCALIASGHKPQVSVSSHVLADARAEPP